MKTLDYLYGSLLALAVLVLLIVPHFKRYLLDGMLATDAGRETAVSEQAVMNQV